MTEKDVVLAKISIIKNCLKRIKEVTKLQPDALESFDVQDIFILNLQRAIQACIDISNAIIAARGYRLPNSYRIGFEVLNENKWIDMQICNKMQKLVGFRNISVHDYQKVDIKILKSILNKNLSDLESFYKQILKKIDGEN